MTNEPLVVERTGSIVTLTLNRPSVGNAINLDLAEALEEASVTCDADDSILCVVLTGAGKLFCGGGDIASLVEAGPRLPDFLEQLVSHVHEAIARLIRMKKPLITAVNGPAAGAGFSLAMLGDIVLATPSAHFTVAYSSIGLSPDAGSTWILPRLLGLRRAQEVCLTNKRISADEAAQMGLVTRVVNQDLLSDQVRLVANDFGRAATGALGRTRNLLQKSFETSLEVQLQAETRAIVESSRTEESRKRMVAFLAKRKANV